MGNEKTRKEKNACEVKRGPEARCASIDRADEQCKRMRGAIDQHAIRIPTESGLLPCLYVPIARDLDAIGKYVGRIERSLAPGPATIRAVLVEAHEPEERDERLAIWDIPEAAVLHSRWQAWVHVDYRPYRRAYMRAFPDVSLTGFDHIMNRRVARLKGFAYLRIVPISRGANSSHGSLSEGWAVEYHGSPAMLEKNSKSLARVQYANLADIVKMLSMKGGGSFMDTVKDAQKLIDLPDAGGKRRRSATRAYVGETAAWVRRSSPLNDHAGLAGMSLRK